MLRAESVTVGRGRRVILSGVELSVGAGSVVQLAGANGSGKTCLLRVLAGLAAVDGAEALAPASCVALTAVALLAARRWFRRSA